MADLYLSRKLAVSSSTTCSSNDPNWLHSSPNQGSKIHSRGSVATIQGENDVEELEMLLEVIIIFKYIYSSLILHHTLLG